MIKTGVSEFPVAAGDLLMLDRPWIYSLHPKNFDAYCYRCFKPFEKECDPVRALEESQVENGCIEGKDCGNSQSFPCPGCEVVRYCSTECQTEDKNTPYRHGDECKYLKAMRAKGIQPVHDVLLIFKMMFRLKDEEKAGKHTDGQTLCTPPNGRNYDRLLSHADEILENEERMEAVQKLRQQLNQLLWEADVPDTRSLVEMFGKVKVNSFDIRDQYLRRLGEGLYFGASMFNHSCQRNAVFYFDGTNICLKAIQPIQNMNDVSLSYLELFTTTPLRQQEMQHWYYFQCSCNLCKDPVTEANLNCILCCTPNCTRALPLDPQADDVPCKDCLDFIENNVPKGQKANQELKSQKSLEGDWSNFDWRKEATQRKHLAKRLLSLDMKQHTKIQNSLLKDTSEETLEDVEARCQRMLETTELLFHPTNWTRCLTHDMLGKVLLLMGKERHAEAAKNFELSLPGLRRGFPGKNPRLGLQLLVTAALEMEAGNTRSALEKAKEAEEIFAVSDGRDRSLCKASRHLHTFAQQALDEKNGHHNAKAEKFVTQLISVLNDVLAKYLFPPVFGSSF